MVGIWSTTTCNILESTYIGSSNRTQNVNLLNLSATVKQGLVELDWTNNTGGEAEYFELERSVDGINFENIGNVEVASIDNTPKFYTQKDGNPLIGFNYYRIKMVNFEGNSILSNTKRVTIADMETFGLFPNPADESVKISLRGYQGNNIEIQLIDYFGKRLKTVEINNAADAVYEIDLDNVKNGVYSLWIFSEGKRPIGKKMIVNKRY